MSNQVKITFTAYGQQHYCYIVNQPGEIDFAEGTIHELCSTACIIQTELVVVDQEEFEAHKLSNLAEFIQSCETLEHE